MDVASPERRLKDILKQKNKSKKLLSKDLRFSVNKPLVAIIVDQDLDKEELETLARILEGMKALDAAAVLLGDKTPDLKGVKLLDYSKDNRRLLLEAADIALTFSFNDIEEMLIYGIIPISHEGSGVNDYNPTRETGNGFVYKKEDSWSIFAALVRAVETFKFPYDWKHILRQATKA